LKWAIQKEKDIQETELRRLQKLEDQYQEELKQRQPKTQAELGGQVSLFLKNKKNLEGYNENSKEENLKKEEVSQPVKPGLARQGTIRQGPKPAKPDLAKPGIKPQRTLKESKPEGETKPSVKPGTANAKSTPNDKNIKPPSEKPKGTATGSAKPISSKPVNPIKQAPKEQKQEVKIAESLNVDPTNPVKQNDMQMVENSNPSNTLPVQPVLPTTSN
jgi:hypothetical protein